MSTCCSRNLRRRYLVALLLGVLTAFTIVSTRTLLLPLPFRSSALQSSAFRKTNNNSSKIAYITYSYLDGKRPETFHRFEELVLDALDTWLLNRHYFVVLTNRSMKSWSKLCSRRSDIERRACRRVIPVAVDCPEGYYGDSPCCKMQEGLLRMAEAYPDEFDWYYYGDDDMYIRTDYLEDYLAALPPERPVILTSGPFKRMGVSGFAHEDGDEQKCSVDRAYMYPWGQPIIYSRAAVRTVRRGFELGGFREQCRAFGVTHDVGNQIFNWMYRMPEIRLPPLPAAVPPTLGGGGGSNLGRVVGFHGVGRRDKQFQLTAHAHQREIHAFFVNQTHLPPPYQYRFDDTSGFRRTRTYRDHGDPTTWDDVWHTMPVEDCRGPAPREERPVLDGDNIATTTKDELVSRLVQTSYEVCVVGAGWTGTVLATRYALELRKRVALMDPRPHVGGYTHDFVDEETGIRVHRYGLHPFPMKSDKVENFLRPHMKSQPFPANQTTVLVNSTTLVSFPLDFSGVNILLGLDLRSAGELDAWLATERVRLLGRSPRNAEELVLSLVGRRLYDSFYRPYLKRMWGTEPRDLAPEAAGVAELHDDANSDAAETRWVLPERGYTEVFRNWLRQPSFQEMLDVYLDMDYLSIRDAVRCRRTYFTEPVDMYFASSSVGLLDPLPYRRVTATWRVRRNVPGFQQPSAAVVHDLSSPPNRGGSAILRSIEYKHLPGQPASKDTVILTERASDDGASSGDVLLYPIPTDENRALYGLYRNLLKNESRVFFVGPKAEYRYMDLHDEVWNALETFDRHRQLPLN